MKRSNNKRRLMLDSSILITMEENLINIEHAKTSKIISAGMDIMDATLDKTRRDEKDMVLTLLELENLCHLVKEYRDSTHAIVSLRREFQDSYEKFTSERHLLTVGIDDFQGDTLMVLATYKDVERWYEKSHQEVERIDYINEIKKD
jgi:hypothetical protein